MKFIYLLFVSFLFSCSTQHHTHKIEGPRLGSGGERYVLVEGWGVNNLKEVFIKNCNGLVIDGEQRLILLVDDPRNNVIIFDRQGKIIKTWTLNLKNAHGLAVTKEGDKEVLFITDNGAGGHVYKTTLDGKVLMKLAYPKNTGKYRSAREFRPSAVMPAANGDFYVLDGYGKNYVIQYSKKGKFIRIFGGDLGKGEAKIAKHGSHGGIIDNRDPKNPVIIIAGSDQNNLKRFTLAGKYINTIPMPGSNPRDICIYQDKLYIPHLSSNWPKEQNAPGYVSVLDKDNRVIANIGGLEPKYEKGQLQKMTHHGHTFKHPHAVTMDKEGNLYVAQWLSGKTWPLKFIRVKK
jgi:peptidylamidoglycolate lyase